MKDAYKISRIILPIITFIVFSLFFINEESSFIVLSLLFSLIVFGLSFPSSIFSKKMIDIGNRINNKFLKVLYYLGIPAVIAAISLLVYLGIGYLQIILTDNSTDLASALSRGFIFLFVIAVIVIVLLLPYVQSIIVLIINIIKNK